MGKKALKILVSAYACSPFEGGEKNNGWNWTTRNAIEGNEIWCLTQESSKESIDRALKENPIPSLHFIFIKVPQWVDYLYKYQSGVYFHYLYWQEVAYKEAKILDKKLDFDLIHHVTYGSLQLGSALWRLDKPLIFGPAGGGQMAPKSLKKYFYKGWKQEVKRYWISNLLLKINRNTKQTLLKAQMILATNHETLELAQKYGAKNSKLTVDVGLPSEFYPTILPLKPQGKALKILWLGRMFPRKGLPLVLDALGKVENEIPFQLTLIGDGPMSINLEHWIAKNHLKKKVKVMGRVPWEEVKKAYASHDLFMFCTLRDSCAAQYLEAMAHGLPILTLNLHGARNLIPPKAAIKIDISTPEKTCEKLAAAVKQLYNNPNKRKKMGLAGFEFAKTLEWKTRVEKMNKYYHEILNQD
ncbi:glycosyltransferase family 4 protein [Xanthovirga aplysinae]|uniref:glycosyltransferase family 4 protein n=1 Tax=Xanthovirga aplysinae TaxID=2529853 RepID=UPI0012BC8469|nr:glycosyltransferase family 4 protein [Xanthovirga aplysinae]MTI30629.1 glycosyltransferase [Xanthovirga aplysinae]